jgi:hypothetical protein
MSKGRTVISSLLLGFAAPWIFSGCCGKDAGSNLRIREANQHRATNVADKPRIDFSRMPLSFIPNRGQVDEKAKYYAKGSGYTLWLTAEGLVFDQAILPRKERAAGTGAGGEKPRRDVSSLVFVNANPDPAMMAVAETGHRVSYFIGNDPAKWHSDIPTSQAVLYKDLYQGIDLKVYGVAKQIEYDWIVKPGVNPGAIRFACQGVKGTRIDDAGNLLLETEGGELIHHRPLTYQDIDGARVSVQAAYRQTGENSYGFTVGEYDKNHQLIIDPLVLLYSTYLGGRGTDYGYDIAADKSGNVYVTGTTDSADFPTRNPYQTDPSYYDFDAFVTKIDTTQSGSDSLIYSTYLGGEGSDSGNGIAADDSGNVYVTGTTASTDFPTRNPYQTDQGNYDVDVFVTKINTNISGPASLVYSTYLGGRDNDYGKGIAADDSGNAYVAGETASSDFPIRNSYQTYKGNQDAFVSRIDTIQSGAASLVYSTYLGGGSWDDGYGIAADKNGNVFVTGFTESFDFPIKNQYQAYKGSQDAFVTRINTTQSGVASLIYSTYLGGAGTDRGYGIAADDTGNAYLTGSTDSTNFPTKNPYQTKQSIYHGDAFVTRINTTQSGAASLVYSTYLGGGSWDDGYGIAADNKGNVYVTGTTYSTNFPTQYPSQKLSKGNSDCFITKMDTTQTGAASLVYSTYLGGGDNDISSGIALDNSGNVYITGETWSTNFPTQYPYQNDQGFLDAFVAKLSFTWPRILNTEQWELILDKDQGHTSLTLYKMDDGTITADGNWEYSYLGSNNFGTFTGAQVTISGKSIALTATGTATNPTAPPGYTTSPYTGVFSGTAFDGQGSGTFTVSFQTYGWPDKFSGNWQGTRTSGSGITAEPKALPWIMLLLKD